MDDGELWKETLEKLVVLHARKGYKNKESECRGLLEGLNRELARRKVSRDRGLNEAVEVIPSTPDLDVVILVVYKLFIV